MTMPPNSSRRSRFCSAALYSLTDRGPWTRGAILNRGEAFDHDRLDLLGGAHLGPDALQEVVAVEREHDHRSDGADRRRARAAAQQRDLAEVLPRPLLAHARLVDEHLDRAVLDDVEALGLVALGDDLRAGV